jgi:hypothetical protein
MAACSGGPSEAPEPDNPVSISGVQTFNDLSHMHETKRQSYPQKPPVGGPHYPPQANDAIGWQRCGVDYSEPVVDEFAVHSLEHGAVWLTYSTAATSADIAQLQQLAAVRPEYTLLSPYPGQSGTVMATAWGFQLSVDTATDPRLAEFVRAYAGGGQGGEQGADCANGSTLEQAMTAITKG